MTTLALLLTATILGHPAAPAGQAPQPSSSPPSPIVKSELLFDKTPFDSVHASTLVWTKDGLVAAWFAGTREGAPDVGIWTSREANGVWSEPKEVATGVQPDGT